MAMFTFYAIQLGSVRKRDAMRAPCALKIAMEFVIFTTPIGLNCLDFSVQKSFNMSLKIIKDLLDIRLVLNEIDPAKTIIGIYKTDI